MVKGFKHISHGRWLVAFLAFAVALFGFLAVGKDARALLQEDEWAGSGHADTLAEAFTHWPTPRDADIPTSCAKCHSTEGMLDFLAEDGTDPGVVNNAVVVPTDPPNAIYCEACHNDTASSLDSVTFPSGVEVTGLGPEARCMLCHQGRSAKSTVDEAIESSPGPYSFINIHYYAAAASLFGTEVQGGYEVDRKDYSGQGLVGHPSWNPGVLDTCVECHMTDSHNVLPDPVSCACHGDIVADGFKAFRSLTSTPDSGLAPFAPSLFVEVRTLH
jgi:hypothetical protein